MKGRAGNSGDYVAAHVSQADRVYQQLEKSGVQVESYRQRGDTVYFRTAPPPTHRRRLSVNLIIAIAVVAIIGIVLAFGGVASTGEPIAGTDIISRLDAAIAAVLGNFSTMAGAVVGALVAGLLILPAMDKLHTSHRGVWLVVGWCFVGALVALVLNLWNVQ